MRTRATALLGSGLLLTGALFLTACDNTQVPESPGIEEQDENRGGNQGEEPEENQNEDQGEEQEEEEGDD